MRRGEEDATESVIAEAGVERRGGGRDIVPGGALVHTCNTHHRGEEAASRMETGVGDNRR